MENTQHRINLNYRPLLRISTDLNVMSKSYQGHMFILSIIVEVTIICLLGLYINQGQKKMVRP